MTKRITVNLNDLPIVFKEYSELYKSIVDTNEYESLELSKDYCKFDEIIYNYNDVEKILDTYKYWLMPNMQIFNFVNNNREIIEINIDRFTNYISDFEMGKSLLTLVKGNMIDIYKDLVNNNDIYLLEFLCNREMIEEEFYKYAATNLDIVKTLKKYNLIVTDYLLYYEMLKSDDINYLKYFVNNYNVNGEEILEDVVKKNKDKTFIEFIFDRFNINDKEYIVKLCVIHYYSQGLLEFVNKNVININEILEEELAVEIYEEVCDDCLFCFGTYKLDKDLDEELKNDLGMGLNVTLGKWIYFNVIKNYDDCKEIIDWLLRNNFIPTVELLNYGAYWLNGNNFILLYNKLGVMYNQNTMQKAIYSLSPYKVKFLQSIGCPINITYSDFNDFITYKFYNRNDFYDYTLKMLSEITKLLTSKSTGLNVDNSYIINTVIHDDYKYFADLYENYPEMKDYVFEGKDKLLLNERLKQYIEKYNSKTN